MPLPCRRGSVALADRSGRETGWVTSSGRSSVFAGFRFSREAQALGGPPGRTPGRTLEASKSSGSYAKLAGTAQSPSSSASIVSSRPPRLGRLRASLRDRLRRT